MDELQFDIALLELEANGLVQIDWSEECQEHTIRITDKGRSMIGDNLNDFLR